MRTPDVRSARVVGASLAVLAAWQTAAVLRPPLDVLPVLAVLGEGFSYTASRGEATVAFQVRNDDDRTVGVRGIGRSVPGLELRDVVVSGEPTGFRQVGAGAAALGPFDLAPGQVAVVELRYRIADCAAVPAGDEPVPVEVRVGRARGIAVVRLPEFADGPAVEHWPQVAVRDACD